MRAQTHQPATLTQPAAQAETSRHKPDGPLAAAVLAAGLAIFTLGAVTTLAEANASLSAALTWSQRVGALSGESIVEIVVFTVAWSVLGLFLWKRDGVLRPAVITFIVVAVLGYIGTCPTFFHLFS